MQAEILRLDFVSKTIHKSCLLNKANFTLHKGEIHALVGENGAGKSALANCISGVAPFDTGDIFYNESRVFIKNTGVAHALKIFCVGQNTCIVPTLTVAENIFLLAGVPNSVLLHTQQMNEKAQTLLNFVGLEGINPSAKAFTLSTAEKKMVEFARIISAAPKIVILDEITGSMTNAQCANLLRIIELLKKQDITFVYISHRLEEVLEIADRVTVMRDGSTVSVLRKSECSKERLLQIMFGETRLTAVKTERTLREKVVLRAEHLATAGNIKDVSFSLHQGEIIALMGPGKRELARSFYGLVPIKQGTIWLEDKKTDISNPVKAVKSKVGFVPSNRLKRGLILNYSAEDNITLPVMKRISRSGVVLKKLNWFFASTFMEPFGIDILPEQPVRFISGGNQQKILFCRSLSFNPKVLVLINPTEGVDIATRNEIHQKMKELAGQGVAIILCSTEIEELYSCADRLLYIKEGVIFKDIGMHTLTLEGLMEIETGLR